MPGGELWFLGGESGLSIQQLVLREGGGGGAAELSSLSEAVDTLKVQGVMSQKSF